MSVPLLPTRTAEIRQATVFATEAVKRLTEASFTLETRERIGLRYENCIIALFYGENAESRSLAEIWAQAAAQIPGPIFAACNLLQERGVAKAFTEIRGLSNHPLQWAGLRQIPFILVYRDGWPQAFYNGDRTVSSIVDYALVQACEPEYHERFQVPAGMQVEGDRGIGLWKPYPEDRLESAQFGPGVRGYQPDRPPSGYEALGARTALGPPGVQSIPIRIATPTRTQAPSLAPRVEMGTQTVPAPEPQTRSPGAKVTTPVRSPVRKPA